MTSAQVTVTTSATAIVEASGSEGGQSVSVRNRGAVAVYLGGSNVTTSNGYQLDAGEAVGIPLFGETVYGIVASGTCVVHVLEAG